MWFFQDSRLRSFAQGQLPYSRDDVRGVERLRGLAKDLDGLPNTLSDDKTTPEARVPPYSDDTYAASCH